MPTPEHSSHVVIQKVEALGRHTSQIVDSIGFGASLLYEAGYWILLGRRRNQPVHLAPIAAQMMEIGIRAIPIIAIVSVTIGLMLAIQGIDALKDFGAEQQVTLGVALSVVREFSPLITGILVAGRSGAALAARLSTMTIHQEVDALHVMGINPIRFWWFRICSPCSSCSRPSRCYPTLSRCVELELYITTDLGISVGR